MDQIKVFLMLVSGIAWTIVYIDSIRIGFKHKTYAMPFWALALNLSWEVQHGLLNLQQPSPGLQIIINNIWALFDIGILYTFFRYGKKYFPKTISTRWFYMWSIFVLCVSYAVELIFSKEFGENLGGGYAAFLQNLLMSFLFIGMLIQRKGTEGQSLTIAVSKWIGTLAPTLLFGIVGSNAMGGPNKLMLWIGIIIALVDIIYILMFLKAKHIEKANLKPNKWF